MGGGYGIFNGMRYWFCRNTHEDGISLSTSFQFSKGIPRYSKMDVLRYDLMELVKVARFRCTTPFGIPRY